MSPSYSEVTMQRTKKSVFKGPSLVPKPMRVNRLRCSPSNPTVERWLEQRRREREKYRP